MWQHKQEERELKRSEGDIIKSQHMLRRTMKDFEIGENSDFGPIQIFHKFLMKIHIDVGGNPR